MTMTATVIRTNNQSMLVRDEETGREVLVFFRGADRFAPGERVLITHGEQITASIPPQVAASSVERIPAPVPPQHGEPSEMRAVILQRGPNALLVRNLRTGQQVRVEYRHARHFCPRQRVVIRYDTITLSNPPSVTAVDIIPEC